LVGDYDINFCRTHPIFVDWKLAILQVVSTHTHTAPSGKTSLIDLVFVSNLEVLLNCSTVSPLKMMDVHSYHNCVRLTLRWKHKHCMQTNSAAGTNNLEVCKCRFPESYQTIEESDWDLLLPGYDANLAASNWHNKVMEITQACIPQLSKLLLREEMYPRMTHLIRKCNAAFQAAKRAPIELN